MSPGVAPLREAAPPFGFLKGGDLETVASLPLSLSARHLLYFWLLRTTRVFARLEWVLSFALLACGTFSFFAIFFAQCACVGHESFS